MVVGHHQAFAGDDARRAAAELDRRQTDLVEPGLVDVRAQGLVGAGDGEVVVGPHAFLCLGGVGGGEGQDGGRGEEHVTHGELLVQTLARKKQSPIRLNSLKSAARIKRS
ncbi:hypothetical protein D3C80_1677860 [compost metagenome]